jgi:hypothetical protein
MSLGPRVIPMLWAPGFSVPGHIEAVRVGTGNRKLNTKELYTERATARLLGTIGRFAGVLQLRSYNFTKKWLQ